MFPASRRFRANRGCHCAISVVTVIVAGECARIVAAIVGDRRMKITGSTCGGILGHNLQIEIHHALTRNIR